MQQNQVMPLAPSQMFDLRDRVALVTGCGRGIGQAVAVGLAEAGADIVGLYNKNFEETQQKIAATGKKFFPLQLDLTYADRGTMDEIVGMVVKAWKRLDIVVNNAGIIRRAPAVEYSAMDWEETIQVNLNACFYLAQAAGSQMLKQDPLLGYRGKIIQIASLLSYQGGITVPAYTAAKHGVLGMTRALSNEWAGEGINVNAISPGYIRTDNTQALQDNAERNTAILERIPAGRWGEPQDIAGAAIFLASPASNFIHGTALTVDGGWMGR